MRNDQMLEAVSMARLIVSEAKHDISIQDAKLMAFVLLHLLQERDAKESLIRAVLNVLSNEED